MSVFTPPYIEGLFHGRAKCSTDMLNLYLVKVARRLSLWQFVMT